MTNGIGKNTPIDCIAIEDFAEVNVKLVTDDSKKYYYMIQPLFEFSSNYGINLEALISLNYQGGNQFFDIQFTYQKRITVLSENQIKLIYPSGYSIVFEKTDTTMYTNQETTLYFMTRENQNKIEYVLYDQTNEYVFIDEKLSLIQLKNDNQSTTTIVEQEIYNSTTQQKQYDLTTISNSKNLDQVQIEDYGKLKIIYIIRKENENKKIKKYRFSSSENKKQIIITYTNIYQNTGENTLLDEKIQLQNKSILITRTKEYVTQTYSFVEDDNYKIQNYKDCYGNTKLYTYGNGSCTIEENTIGTPAKQYELYFDDKERVQYIYDVINHQYTFTQYNQAGNIILQSIPIFYHKRISNFIQKNNNFIEQYVINKSTSLEIKLSAILQKDELISFIWDPYRIESSNHQLTITYEFLYVDQEKEQIVLTKQQTIYVNYSFDKIVMTQIIPQKCNKIRITTSGSIMTFVNLFNCSLVNQNNYNASMDITSTLRKNQIRYFEYQNKKISKTQYVELEYDGNKLKKSQDTLGIINKYTYDDVGNLIKNELICGEYKNVRSYTYTNYNQLYTYSDSFTKLNGENWYEFNSTLQSCKSNEKGKIKYIYPLKNQPFFNQIIFNDKEETKHNFSYLNREIYTIGAKSNEETTSSEIIRMDRGNNNELQSITYAYKPFYKYQYYQNNGCASTLVKKEDFGKNSSIYFNYDQQLEKIESISYGNGTSTQKTLYSFNYELSDFPYALTSSINNIRTDNCGNINTNYLYTDKGELYQINTQILNTNNLDIRHEVSIYANKNILSFPTQTLIKRTTNQNAKNETTVINDYRYHKRNFKICDFAKDFMLNDGKNSCAVLYNKLIPVSYFNENNNDFANYIGYQIVDGEINQISMDDIQKIESIPAFLSTNYIIGSSHRRPIKNYSFDLYFPFNSAPNPNPIATHDMSLVFMLKLPTTSSVNQTIIACIGANQNPLSSINDNLYLLYESIDGKKTITFSICKGIFINNHIVFDTVPLCEISMDYTQSWNCMMIRQSKHTLTLCINDKIASYVHPNKKDFINNVQSIVFGLKFPFGQDDYFTNYEDSDFYIANILIPYQQSFSNEDFLSYYHNMKEAITFNINNFTMKQIATHFSVINGKNIQYISFDKNLISNSNLNPVVDLFEATLDEKNNIFHYDTTLKKNVFIIGSKKLEYIGNNDNEDSGEIDETLNGITYIIKARMPKISNNELDNDYYNLISLDYDGFVFDIKYNNLGYVEICNTSYNERLLSREKYTHFIVQIDDNSIHVYADSKKIISCQQSIALCKNRRFSIVIGHDSNDDGAYPCFVNDFYLVMDKISSDEAINIANLSNSIKNLYDYHSLLKESQIHHQNKLIFKRNFTYMTDNININNGQTKYKIGKSLITSERFKLKDNEKECTYEYNDANLLKKYNNPITQQYISYTYDSFID